MPIFPCRPHVHVVPILPRIDILWTSISAAFADQHRRESSPTVFDARLMPESRRVDSIRVKTRWHPEGTWLSGLGMGLRRLFGSGSSILDPAMASFSLWVLCLALWTL